MQTTLIETTDRGKRTPVEDRPSVTVTVTVTIWSAPRTERGARTVRRSPVARPARLPRSTVGSRDGGVSARRR